MATQSLFRTGDSRYSRAQLEKIYVRYARATGRMEHSIMINAYVDAWVKQGTGPLEDAIEYHNNRQTAATRYQTYVYRFAFVTVIAIVVLAIVAL